MGGKSYTGKGDGGDSGLPSGTRARKSEPIFEAVGMLDELNSVIGMARVEAGKGKTKDAESPEVPQDEQLEMIQADLFEAGSYLCGYWPAEKAEVFNQKLKRLEVWIDKMDAEMPALSNFILPGGCPLSAELHYARTVCRRVERRVEGIDVPAKKFILPYLNRLGSYFFARARFENLSAGVSETVWKTKENE